jgi:hypothetical protein
VNEESVPINETIYRAMTVDEDGAPRLDASARTLGARPMIDVPGDASEGVETGTGGMSASSDTPENLPSHRRPASFGGSGADDVFAIGTLDLGSDLTWRPDPDGPLGHGFVEPVRRMAFSDYQDALWATRAMWRRVDP